MNRARDVWIALLLGLMLSACSLAAPPAEAPAPPGVAEGPTGAAPTAPPAAATIEAPPTAPMAEAEPTLDDSIPRGDPNLKASDPSQVRLTGEKPRLVEFFAFW